MMMFEASTFSGAVVFWISSFLVLYPYLIYPVILMLARTSMGSESSMAVNDSSLPSVSLIISAFNEERVIAEKLANSLALDYPADRLQIIVVSDASSDNTDRIVADLATGNDRIQLCRLEQRGGKTAGLNKAVALAQSDLIVFSDANAIYDTNAIRALVNEFSAGDVGCVVGSALYIDDPDVSAKQSEGLYWKYELWLKKLESDVASVVGGDGAIYAIRRELFWPLEPNDINDFVNPLQIVGAGYRCVFTEKARCFEMASDEFAKEFSRKRRIVNRSFRAVLKCWSQLQGRELWKFRCMLVSHKLIRWFSLLFIALATVSSAVLVISGSGMVYTLAFVALLLSIVLAGVGRYLDHQARAMPGWIYLPYYVHLVGLAGILGIWDQYRGVEHVMWGHIRN